MALCCDLQIFREMVLCCDLLTFHEITMLWSADFDAMMWSADFPWNDAMLGSADFPWNDAMLWYADFQWNDALLWYAISVKWRCCDLQIFREMTLCCDLQTSVKWRYAGICRFSVKWRYAGICRLSVKWRHAVICDFREMALCCDLPTFREMMLSCDLPTSVKWRFAVICRLSGKWSYAVICRLSVKWRYAVICQLSVKWCYAAICRLPWNDAMLWSADFPWNDAMLWPADFPWNNAMLWSPDFPWNEALLWSAEFREMKLCCNLPIAVICRLPWNGAMLWSADFPWNGAMLWRVAPKYYLTSRAKNILFGFRICSPSCAHGDSSRKYIVWLYLNVSKIYSRGCARANIIFGCVWNIFLKMCSWWIAPKQRPVLRALLRYVPYSGPSGWVERSQDRVAMAFVSALCSIVNGGKRDARTHGITWFHYSLPFHLLLRKRFIFSILIKLNWFHIFYLDQTKLISNKIIFWSSDETVISDWSVHWRWTYAICYLLS